MARELEGSLARACSDVAAAMTGPVTGRDVIREIAVRAAEVLHVGSAAVLIESSDGGEDLTVATDSLVPELYAAERATGEGPVSDARRDGVPVPVPTMVDAGRRWSRWTEATCGHDVGALLVVPSRSDQRRAGLVVASSRVRRWSAHDLTTAQVLADLAAGCAAWEAELNHAHREVGQLQEALAHRVVIEQAKGILAGELGCTLEDAFGLLRDQARRRSATVRSVADAVVRLGLRPPTGPPHPAEDPAARPAG